MIAGTPRFISPEQCSGQGRVDGRSDIYSLGAVAYVLLTGRPPFNQASVVEVVIAHLREEAPPPSHWVPDLPEDLQQVILRCLAKQPQDRFPNVEVLDADLAACESAGRWTQEQARSWWRKANTTGQPQLAAAEPSATLPRATSPS
jgi:serine/threonine-protein kinase